MKVTRISRGNYKVVTPGETYIVRNIHSWNRHEDKVTHFWVANCCEDENDCHDDNSCCGEWKTFKEFKTWVSNLS
jgi:hypothetical protein